MDGIPFELTKPPVVNRADDDSKFKRNADSSKKRYYASLTVNDEYQASMNHLTLLFPSAFWTTSISIFMRGMPTNIMGKSTSLWAWMQNFI